MAFVAVVVPADVPPPASVWSDGKRFCETPDGTRVGDFAASFLSHRQCGFNLDRVRSASGAIVPVFGDPVVLAERPSWIRCAWASVPLVGTPPRSSKYVYELAEGRPDSRDDRGRTWFRYDLSKATEE